MNGFISLLKPPGMTSNDAVMAARRMLGEKRVGHAGTLDPEAAGVLPLGAGKATRLLSLLSEAGKVYWCELILGCETDTCDAHGAAIRTSPEMGSGEALMAALPRFIGCVEQRPPIYSALRRQGKRLYELAREGIPLDVPARGVEIYGIELLEAQPPRYTLRVRCGPGTYIRSLCRDLGAALGGAGHMGMLVREAVGAMRIENSVTFEELREEGERLILPMTIAVEGWQRAAVPDAQFLRLINGNPLSAAVCGAAVRPGRCALMRGEELVAVGRVLGDGDTLRVDALLIDREKA